MKNQIELFHILAVKTKPCYTKNPTSHAANEWDTQKAPYPLYVSMQVRHEIPLLDKFAHKNALNGKK